MSHMDSLPTPYLIDQKIITHILIKIFTYGLLHLFLKIVQNTCHKLSFCISIENCQNLGVFSAELFLILRYCQKLPRNGKNIKYDNKDFHSS